MLELYEHQKEAFEKFKDENDIALFLEQGCGKSAITLKIAEYKFNKKEIEQLLVIAPNDVHRQWAVEQAPLWLSCKKEVECYGGRGGVQKFYDPDEPDTLGMVCVNIDTFSTANKWQPVVDWANAKKTMIVLDEATSIKNVNSKRTQNVLCMFNDIVHRGRVMVSSCKKPSTQVRCVLTGTPVTNGPMDLWSIMEFVHPNFFGDNWWSFRQKYGMFTKMSVANSNGVFRDVPILLNENTWHGIKSCSNYAMAYNVFGCTEDTYFTVQSQAKYMGPYKHADVLKGMLDRVAVFKKLTDCLDMPEQNFIIRKLVMSSEQEKAYREMKETQMTLYKDHMATAMNKLTMATRLAQISSGFIRDKNFVEKEDSSELDEEAKDLSPDEVVWLGGSNPKLEALVRDVDESDKPIIILTRYSAESAKIYDMLKNDYSCMLYTGWKKIGTIEDFKQGKYEVMIANIACIARGFNLQISHTILYYSNSFSMELREQSQSRIFRSGQKNICKYVDYCYSGTVDEQIIEVLRNKKSMLDYFRNEEVR